MLFCHVSRLRSSAFLHIFTLQVLKACTCQQIKSHGGIFVSYLPIRKKPMDGRLSSMQNYLAILQSIKNPRLDFFARTCQFVKSHGWRLSA
ncbi:MAG: hypothetical protein IKN90_08230, partial [Treponema sp.]|nr:hypothetical protein [Treponema sp.]